MDGKVRMKDKNQKIRYLEEIMELEEGLLKEDSILSDYEEWDSLSIISYIALMDSRFHKTVSIDEIKKFVTVEDAISKM